MKRIVIRNLRTGQKVLVKEWRKTENYESVEGYYLPDNVHVLMTFRSTIDRPVADRSEWVIE